MTAEDKLAMVKTIMGPDAPDDATIAVYLDAAKREILSWRYSYAKAVPEDVPPQYETTQIQAVINGFTQRGVEGQSISVENGIHRHFNFSDMVRYIRANVIAYVGFNSNTPSEIKGEELREQIMSEVKSYIHQNALEVTEEQG